MTMAQIRHRRSLPPIRTSHPGRFTITITAAQKSRRRGSARCRSRGGITRCTTSKCTAIITRDTRSRRSPAKAVLRVQRRRVIQRAKGQRPDVPRHQRAKSKRPDRPRHQGVRQQVTHPSHQNPHRHAHKSAPWRRSVPLVPQKRDPKVDPKTGKRL